MFVHFLISFICAMTNRVISRHILLNLQTPRESNIHFTRVKVKSLKLFFNALTLVLRK